MGNEEVLRLIEEAAETGATELDLRNKGLSKLPPEIGQLTSLTKLYLSSNQLTELPPELFQLINLTSLALSQNQLIHLSSYISHLNKLTYLGLGGNQFSYLPREIVQLTNLSSLYLDDNPLISPPREIAHKGIKAICQYFTSLEGEIRTLSEVKIHLVGDGAAGKTSLTRCLTGQKFNAHETTTHGIRIKYWQLDTAKRPIKINLWDFGGQEVMHATHQLFLSRRSLYVLVLDGRRDERSEYWLRHIESFGGSSPVLIILNKQDSNPGFDLDRRFLQKKYPFIRGFWQTSCSTGDGITRFREALSEELSKVKFIATRWANTWFQVKEQLEQMDKPYINYDQFVNICTEAGVTEEISQDVLVEFLNDLGVVVHFKEFELEDIHVLKPKWVTEAVYKIINAPLIAEEKGILPLCRLKEILRQEKEGDYRYPRSVYSFIIELMKKFELCYELEGERVLIPQLLDVAEPADVFDDREALRFMLYYEDFLPPAVMPRFIVKRHHEIKGNRRWRSGVVLENMVLESTAVVRVDNEARRIHIAVSGVQPKAFLTVIMLSLREINAGFEGLKVSERIPMPDDPERTADYDTLINYAEQGMDKYIPEGSKKAYKVSDLLDTIDEEKMRKMLATIPGGIADKGSFMDVIGRNLKAEPELFGFGIDLKTVGEAAWIRYKAWWAGRKAG